MKRPSRRQIAAGLLALPLAFGSVGAGAQRPAEPPAALALDEAEIRERMMTAIAITNGIRTQGRALFLARHQTRSAEEHLRALPPVDPRRADYERRLATLVERQRQLDATIERDFEAYLFIVSEILRRPRVRVRRIGEQLSADLRNRELEALGSLLALLREHLEEAAHGGGLGKDARKWLEAIDDTRVQREERFDKNIPPPVIGKSKRKESEI